MDTTLADIKQHYHLELIDNQQYLINKHNGHISTLNNSASILFDLLSAGLSVNEAIAAIAASAQQTNSDISAVINDFLASIVAPEKSEAYPPTFVPKPINSIRVSPFRACYLINTRCIEVFYSSEALLAENHALLQPMQCLTATPINHRIDIIETGENTELYVNGRALLGTQDASWVNGLLRSCIIQLAYPSLAEPMVLHAAGLCKNGHTALFTGPSGAGKSTLAAHFILNGFNYLGDDTIPIDMRSNMAFALPTALSLKSGSWELFEAHNEQLSNGPLYREFDKPMKTLIPKPRSMTTATADIRALIFNRYELGASNTLNAIDLNTALNLIQTAETKFNPDTISTAPREMLHWLNKVPKYTLHYDNLDCACDIVSELLA